MDKLMVDNKNINDTRMLDYFWREKGDFKRYVGYDRWAERNPEFARGLDQLVWQRDQAEKAISSYIEQLYRWYGTTREDAE